MSIERFREKAELKETRRLRGLMMVAAVFYPLWAPIIALTNPAVVDPLPLRLLVSFALVSIFFYLGKKELSLAQVRRAFVCGGVILTTHFYFVLLTNPKSMDLVAGAVIIVATIVATLPSRSAVIAYASIVSLGSLLFALSPETPLGIGIYLVAGTITASAVGTFVQFSRFASIEDQANSASETAMILNNLVEGVVFQARDGTIYKANAAAEHILGLPSENIVGKASQDPVWGAIHEDGSDWEGSTHPAMIALSTGLPQTQRVMGLRRASGAVTWISINAKPIFRGDETVPHAVVASFQDITAKRESENLLEEQRLKLISASKMSSLGEMAAGVAHEINNPLAIISGRASQLKRVLEATEVDKDKGLDLVSKIEATVGRISKIVSGLRTFARDGRGDPMSENSISSIVEETLDLCRERFTKNNVEVEMHKKASMDMISCRRGEISQIILNLLHNAFDAMEEQSSAKKIEIELCEQSSRLQMRIKDSGPGISPEIRNKIMQPFFTTKPVGKGTGLGLSISMGIAEAHGGKLFLDPNLSSTCFVLDLPAAKVTGVAA